VFAACMSPEMTHRVGIGVSAFAPLFEAGRADRCDRGLGHSVPAVTRVSLRRFLHGQDPERKLAAHRMRPAIAVYAPINLLV
jgi:hypothetical protein